MRIVFILGSLVLFISCGQKKIQPTGVVSKNAMVVSAREEASKIGLEILKQGGNAFDAMVATELALAVAYPFAGNLGGGGFMVYRKNDGSIGALDYREKAPIAAKRDMYLDSLGNVIPGKSIYGGLSIGVPGTIAGVFETHRAFGSLPIKEIIAPIIELAETGVVVTKKQALRLEKYREAILRETGEQTHFYNQCIEGDTLRYQALAETLKQISKEGLGGFYEGPVADKLVDFIQDKGGIITKKDLLSYNAAWRQPVVFNYKDLKLISMSPPSSGGVTLYQMFKMMEPYKLSDYGHNSQKYVQLFTEAARRAYADRNYFLGDPDFVDIPLDVLLTKSYVENRMDNFSFDKATSSSDIGHGQIKIMESQETTHYSIVDKEGNAVSVTTTLNGAYGSKIYCDELGFFLNNEMDDFSAKPGAPNMFGLTGAEANSIAPGKRMLSSMTPTIVEKDDQLYMVVGSPGGSTIITAVAQTIMNVYEFDLSMQEAVNAPRLHHQWKPDYIIFETEGFSEDLKDGLKSVGYKINTDPTPILGKVDAIKVLVNGSLEGGADKRGDDTAVGY
ncbi:gamma-glutamyltransferase [Eudoraea chungangensis]|uniref:gamma-glutamyltransferase n=1 Tax=Eudoraea chungangensis TaxID=1481905 RepID=UPI0023EB110A|nr:gamma-glutamyltransferase [Eudoraea chungangensis]